MKKNIFKILTIITLIIMLGTLATGVYAAYTPPNEENQVRRTVTVFLDYLEDSNSIATYYIDSNNTKLYSEVQDKLNSYTSIKYQITNITKNRDTYKVDVKFEAEGIDWEVKGHTAHFDVKEINGSFKITSTNFMELTDPAHIVGVTFSILALVFGGIGFVFFAIVVVIIIVVVIVVKKSKKK